MDGRVVSQEEIKLCPNPSFVHCIGSSQSGKTFLTVDLLCNWSFVFAHQPRRILLFYSFWQEAYDRLREKFGDQFSAVQGFPGVNYLRKLEEELKKIPGSISCYLIIDDLDNKIFKDPKFPEVVNIYVHHLRLCLWVLSHNIVVDSPVFRQTTRNANYYVLWDSVRDRSSLARLSNQVFQDKNFLPLVLKDVNSGKKYSEPILVDLRPTADEGLRVRTLSKHPEETCYIFTKKC